MATRMTRCWLGIALAAGLGACAGTPAKSGSGPREPLVAPETVEASGELEGRQQNFMDSLNQTPSEQAGTRHEEDRARRPTGREGR